MSFKFCVCHHVDFPYQLAHWEYQEFTGEASLIQNHQWKVYFQLLETDIKILIQILFEIQIPLDFFLINREMIMVKIPLLKQVENVLSIVMCLKIVNLIIKRQA